MRRDSKNAHSSNSFPKNQEPRTKNFGTEVPSHIGFIVDGNRRWARENGLEPYEGHARGREVLHEVLIAALEHGVKYVSAYLFSSENWKRQEAEVSKLMELFVAAVIHDMHMIIERDVRLRIIGDREGLSAEVREAIDEAESQTAACTSGELIICWNYGGQQEITHAVKQLMDDGHTAVEVTPELISQYLYAPDVPPCDLIVRTSGEHRLSNFMLWRSAYSELLFLDKNWPDMTADDIPAILEEYNTRHRRYGG